MILGVEIVVSGFELFNLEKDFLQQNKDSSFCWCFLSYLIKVGWKSTPKLEKVFLSNSSYVGMGGSPPLEVSSKNDS